MSNFANAPVPPADIDPSDPFYRQFQLELYKAEVVVWMESKKTASAAAERAATAAGISLLAMNGAAAVAVTNLLSLSHDNWVFDERLQSSLIFFALSAFAVALASAVLNQAHTCVAKNYNKIGLFLTWATVVVWIAGVLLFFIGVYTVSTGFKALLN